MTLPVKLREVADMMDAASDMVTAYINRRTGELTVLTSEEELYADDDGDDDGEVPEWQTEVAEQAKRILNDEDFIELPDQYDIHEYAIMERFCYSLSDRRIEGRLLQAISKKGAFRKFKDRIAEEGVREDWFAFKDKELKKIAAGFLEAEGISFTDE